ncbi:MAG TPA: hypothetical protein VLQ93_01725 [Myxococcaceae bacterium]|nr:hypothetical protein [Myxococcaceae bacterium]
MVPDSAQYPLLEEVSEFFRGESAIARRSLRMPGELAEDARSLPPSLELEFLAEVGALVYPDRVLLGLRGVRWFPRAAELPASARLVGRARQEADGEVSVSLSLEQVRDEGGAVLDDTESPHPICRAVLQFGDTYRLTPAPQQFILEPRPEQLHNGGELYALAARPDRVSEAFQVVTWARQCELGRLQGGLAPPRQLVKALPPNRLQVAPSAMEGTLHMVQWLWYAFSGELSRVVTISEATWYRQPRRGERLLCDVQLRGTGGGLASCDALVRDLEGIPVLELHGIGTTSLPAEEPAPPLPRLAWQSFVKCLTPR